MVSNLSLLLLAVTGVVSLLLPVLLAFWLHSRKELSWKALGVGAGVFILFAYILEQMLHASLLYFNESTAEVLKNPWIYALYGSFTAALFEETGRYLAFRFILKEQRTWNDGLSYGLGHGGVETLLIGALGSLQMIVYANLINSGTFGSMLSGKMPHDQLAFLHDMLTQSNSWVFALGLLERIIALMLQIGLSLLVLEGVRSGRMKFVAYAFLLHMLFDFAPALYQKGILNIWVTEGILVILAIPVGLWILRGRKRLA